MKSSAVKPGYTTIAICVIASPLLCECLAVLVGRNAKPSNEIAPQRLSGAEAAAGGDDRDGVVGLLELTAGGFSADALDVGAGRLADLVGEQPGEVTRAHCGATGQLRDAVRTTGFRLD